MPVSSATGQAAGFADVFGFSEFSGSGDNPFEGVAAAAGTSSAQAYSTNEGIGAITAIAIVSGIGSALQSEGVGSAAGIATVDGFIQVAVIQQTENPKRYFGRIINKRDGANGISEIDFVREDISVYPGSNQSPLLSGGSLGGSPVTISPDADHSDQSRPGTTRLMLLDIPQLVSQHTGPGFYAAASGASSGWIGAVLYEKQGSEYIQIAELGSRAVIGRTSTKLNSGSVTTFDNTGRTYVFDDTNTVDVVLVDSESELTSVSDADLFLGVNAAAIGQAGRWEIICFGTATQLEAKKFRLSHLLRGLKGTEWAIATHSVGDGFVLLDSAIRRINDAQNDLDLKRKFRVVSVGATFDSANDQSFTDAGISLKPLSPVYLRAEEDIEQNRTIRWYRRSRLNGLAGRDTYDPAPPLGENIERYEIDILDSIGTTILRTITVTSESALYTAAQQTADHGSVPSSLNLCIYQISDIRGRGYAGCTTISVFDSVSSVLPSTTTYPYVVALTVPGKPGLSKKYIIHPPPLVIFLPEDFVGSRATLETATTASLVFTIKKNGSSIGTITFSAAGTIGAFAQVGSGDISFSVTDKITLESPASQDVTAADLGVSILGYRLALAA